MNRQRRIITGGAGFIGSSLADRLLGRGYEVIVFDDLSRPGAEVNLAWLRAQHGDDFRFLHGDVRNPEELSPALESADVIYHLAGQTAVTTSVADPRLDFEANALGTLNVLEGARLSGTDPVVIYASTNKVYGSLEDVAVVEQATRYTFTDLPHGIGEEQPLEFSSPYACSKGAGEQYALTYSRLYGLRTVVFRQSCVYGPRQMGVEDQGWVAWFLIAALLRRPLTIFGDGKQVRDLLYIDDLLEAYDAAVDHIDDARGRVYNVGGGASMTLSVWLEFEPLLTEIFGDSPGNVSFGDWRPGDQRVFFCDTGRARRELGWQPRVEPQDGIARLADWVRGHEEMLLRTLR